MPDMISGDPLAAGVPAGTFDVWDTNTNANLLEILPALQEFVEALARTYVLSDAVLLPCWPLHQSVLVELEGLREYRGYLYASTGTASGDAATSWHRELDMAMVRLRRWTAETGCNSREHNPQRTPSWLLSEGPVLEHYAKCLNTARDAVRQAVENDKREAESMNEERKARELYERVRDAE